MSHQELVQKLNPKKILFILTGSIACFKSCALISKLVQDGFDIEVIATENALKFVGEATLEGLTGKPVHKSLWQNSKLMEHIQLNRWADLIVVAPATANYINKIANGIADDLATTTYLAHDFKKPFWIIPAMNTAMWEHPQTKESIDKLKKFKVEVVEPKSGHLACNEVGSGRFPEPSELQKRIESYFFGKNDRRILITAGGTSEPIDDVRVITNKSSGKTAALIADEFIRSGYDVTFLHSDRSVLPNYECKSKNFTTFKDLKDLLIQELKSPYDIIIHAAAISDYTVKKFDGKLSSKNNLTLNLEKNEKLVQNLKNWSVNKKVKLFAFKMTSKASDSEVLSAVESLDKLSDCDFVVHNDTSEFAWGNDRHPFHLWEKSRKIKYFENVKELAIYLCRLSADSLSNLTKTLNQNSTLNEETI